MQQLLHAMKLLQPEGLSSPRREALLQELLPPHRVPPASERSSAAAAERATRDGAQSGELGSRALPSLCDLRCRV